jgi:hypothetical protein
MAQDDESGTPDESAPEPEREPHLGPTADEPRSRSGSLAAAPSGADSPAGEPEAASVEAAEETRNGVEAGREAEWHIREEGPPIRPDDSSFPPVDLDARFFDGAVRHSDPGLDLEERDPRMALKLTATVAQRRAHLAKYVKMAVAGAAVLCLAALVKVAVARNLAEADAKHPSAATVARATPSAPLAASIPASAASDIPAVAQPAAPAEPSAPSASVSGPTAVPSDNEHAQAGPASAAPSDSGERADPNGGPASNPSPATSSSVASEPSSPPSEPDPKAAAKEKNACRTALERGKLADAIEAGERSVALDPTDSEAWLILGAAYQEKGNMKDARRCYHECIAQGKRGPKYECMAMPH